MDRLAWGLSAAVLILSGVYLHRHLALDWLSYLLMGIGAGIGCALAGSLVRDALGGRGAL